MSASLAERWHTRELAQALESTWRAHRADTLPSIDVQAVAEVDSTNTRLLEAARDDAVPHLRLLVAQAQTAGRGRLGRAWHASPGASLAFSLAVPMTPDAWSSLIVGAAVADAIEPQREEAPHVMLKWPNDVWLRDASSPFGGRKLGGILLETATTPAGRVLVAGIGLNLRTVALPDAPVYGIAGLEEMEAERGGGAHVGGPDVLMRVAPAVLGALLRPASDAGPRLSRSQGGPAPWLTQCPLTGPGASERSERGGSAWRDAWMRRDLLAGRRVEASTANERITGIALGIDNNGALRLQRDDGGSIVAISSGEVSVRPIRQ